MSRSQEREYSLISWRRGNISLRYLEVSVYSGHRCKHSRQVHICLRLWLNCMRYTLTLLHFGQGGSDRGVHEYPSGEICMSGSDKSRSLAYWTTSHASRCSLLLFPTTASALPDNFPPQQIAEARAQTRTGGRDSAHSNIGRLRSRVVII
jgi:hypothetical protein